MESEVDRRHAEKKPYTPPKLIVHGDVEAITKWTGDMVALDAERPAGTPFNDLTFS